MIFRFTVGLLIVLMNCSCTQQTLKSGLKSENGSYQNLATKTGLKFETGINRGITPNDSLGITNFLIHTTSVITNDSTIPIQLQLALSKEYEFPAICNDNKYKVFLLPKELTPNPNNTTLWNSITNGFEDFINTCIDTPYIFNKTLYPSEKCVIAIATLYPSPTNCGVVPNAVFSQDNKGLYLACGSQINQDTTDPQLEIGVKLGYYYGNYFGTPPDSCIIIPCGQISYPDL
jgi:hypothetical protein